MPDFKVKSESTESTSQTLLNDFNQLEDLLSTVKKAVDDLLAEGYSTPSAQQTFSPFFDKFAQGFKQVNDGLQGISQYVKGVGEAFIDADQGLASKLGSQS